MRVLVTGAGIIGCQIARLLADRGDFVALYDLAPNPDHMGAILDLTKVQIVQGDIADIEHLRKTVRELEIDHVAHTAAILAAAAQQFPARAIAVNITGTANILELAREKLVRRVIIASSTSVAYGTFNTPAESPIREDFSLSVCSQAPPSFYTATKLSSEFMVHNYVKAFGIDAAILRYGAVVGVWPGPTSGILSRMFQALLAPASRGEVVTVTDPAQVWSGVEEFVDPRDCARGTVAALDANSLQARVYNITNPTPYTYSQVLDTVRTIFPEVRIDQQVNTRNGIANFPYPRHATSDMTLARDELGFVPQYTLEDSFRYFVQVGRFSRAAVTSAP